MKIQISDLNYHISRLNRKEFDYIKRISSLLFSKYPDLKKTINKKIKDSKLLVSDEFIDAVLTAFLYSLRDNDFNQDKLLKELKTDFNVFLPIILENAKEFSSSHYLIYEPKVATTFNICNYVTSKLSSEFDDNFKNIKTIEEENYDFYTLLDCTAFFRTIKSSLYLFSLGDDVHGIALYRGAIELLSTLLLSKDFKEEYVKFKKYNVYLQHHKIDGFPIPKEMKKELGKNVNNEDYIKYGWALNKNGKRIKTLSEFIKLANADSDNISSFLHYSSEFVHEDYAGVQYDFIRLRREFVDIYVQLASMMLDLIEDNTKKFNKYRNLIKSLER